MASTTGTAAAARHTDGRSDRAPAQADPRRAVHGAVHQRLRHDGDERGGDVGGQEPRHHRLRRAVGARPLLARDGLVHAHRRQARRRVGPPHDVHARHLHVRRRRADHRPQHGPADDDPRLVAARGPGLGADDPGDLRHRRHHLPGRQAARLGVRRRRRHGRHGRGPRAARLRLPHDVPHAGASRSCWRSAWSSPRSSSPRASRCPSSRGPRRGSTTWAPSSPRSAWRSSCSACCRRASTAGRPPACPWSAGARR